MTRSRRDRPATAKSGADHPAGPAHAAPVLGAVGAPAEVLIGAGVLLVWILLFYIGLSLFWWQSRHQRRQVPR